MQQPSDEIKARLDIVDVLREYIQLKPAGINFRAVCPFHREKTPSFMVSPEKQIWHCFGCGKGGDIFSFVQEIEGLSFVEALRILAPKAGVELRQQDPKLTTQRNRILDILEISAKYYRKSLLDSPQAKEARSYLNKRGLSDETIDEWHVGYAPESWDDLINFLKSKGFRENEIFLSGMSVKKEGTNRFYNRFRDRIIFPINDINGNTVAFSARINPAKEEVERMGKYINSPQTMVYDKSNILFGLDRAKIEIKKNDLAIIVEGQMDVITAHQAGYKNVIASSGTALTSNQIIILKRYSNNIALAFDMDAAGQTAADRGIREAIGQGMNIKVITLPAGKDPDECIKNNPKDWEEAVGSAKDVMQYYFENILDKADLDNIETRRQAIKELLIKLNNFGSRNRTEQDYWIRKISQAVDSEEDSLRSDLAQINLSAVPNTKVAPREKNIDRTQRVKPTREELISELLLALVIKFPDLIDYINKHLMTDHIIGVNNKNVYKSLIIYYNNNSNSQELINQINYNELRKWISNESESEQELTDNFYQKENKIIDDQLKLLDKLVILADRDYYNIDRRGAKNEIIRIIMSLKKHYLSIRMKEIGKLIAISEREGRQDEVNNLMEELKSLSDEVRSL